MDCLTSLLIHDGLLMVMCFLGIYLLQDSRILFLSSSNPCAASLLTMRRSSLSSSRSGGLGGLKERVVLWGLFSKADFAGGRGYETGLFAGVIMHAVVLVGILCALSPVAVYSVAVHIEALSEFPRIFGYIRVEICAFWSASIFRASYIFFA